MLLSSTTNKDCQIDLLIIFLLYSSSFILLLINFGFFFDDSVLYKMPPAIVIDTFGQAGNPLGGHFHNLLLSIGNGITPYRILTFSTYFFSAVFLYFVLCMINEIDRFDRLLIVIFFSVLPVNSARIAMINAPYAVCHFLFWLGFLFLSLYLKDKKVASRIAALAFFLVSFITSSLLVFYVTVIAYIAYIDFYKRRAALPLTKHILGYSDFILLPFLFWVIKSIFFKPSGLYAGYNIVSLKNLDGVSELFKTTLDASFLQVLNQSFEVNTAVSLIGLGGLIFILLKNYRSRKEDANKLLFFYTGVLLFILAVFPYNAVRRIPELYDGNSRHQLLIPLGFSLILIYGTKIFIPFNKIQKPVYSLFIAAFVLTNVHFYAEFQVDWFKQASLIENFKKSDIIRGNTTFLFDDKTEDLNASKRTFRFYEYTELMKLAFGDETRFGQRKQDFETIEKMKRYTKTHYNIKDYEWAEPQYIVEIHSRQRFGKKELVKLKILELFKESKFREEIREYIALKYQKLT